jgi:hypothetical protein
VPTKTNKVMTNLSIKEFERKIRLEAKIQKKNSKKVEENKKKIQYIISDADSTNIDNIVQWLESMKEMIGEDVHCQTIKAYAQFHSGRASGVQIAIDLLNTIKKNELKKLKNVKKGN